MHNVNVMKVSYCLQDLLYYISCLFLSEDSSFKDFIKELATLTQFSYNIVSLFVGVDFIKFQDIRVIQLTQDLDFVFKSLFFFGCHCFLANQFYCADDFSRSVDAFSYFAKSTLAEYNSYLVVFFKFSLVLCDEDGFTYY